jgi:serine/threonine protein kinase/formylglycine-generating enzyme required for sulfatase activity
MVATAPPDMFGEYRLLRRLGRGAMGEVHLALDTLLDRHVALKIVRPPDEKSRARFFIEARAAARLQHPNVAAIHRVGELSGKLYIVSELVRGQSLDRLPLPIPWPRIIELGIGLAKGLSAAHRAGVLHRDIKPANAVVANDGEVKLIDFGLAKLFESPTVVIRIGADDSSEDRTWRDDELGTTVDPSSTPVEEHSPIEATVVALNRASPALTRHGALMGTPFYLAPEIWEGEEASVRSDIYSLGAVLYELASGRPPHAPELGEPTGVVALQRRVADRDPPRLSSLVPDVHPGLEAEIERCIARRPEDRFGSAEQLLDALLRLSSPTLLGVALPQGNPYRGLHAFQAEHRALFFGRQAEVRAVVERLRHDRFVLVAGDSGLGKSSMCRAGILPQLPAELHDRRVWSILEMLPGRRPLAALESALWAHVDRDALPAQTRSLAAVERVRLRPGTGLVIFVDQLEELVTLSDPSEAERCTHMLFAMLSATPGIRVLATARSDFLTRLTALPGLGEDIARAIYLLRPMSPQSIREAIVGPAKATGLCFESEEDVELLVKSAMGSEGGLPLLQFALAELWQMRDVAQGVIAHGDLVKIGGVEGALARHADHVLEGLLPAQRMAAPRILTQLVTAEETRARQPLSALSQLDPHAEAALEALVRGRLVMARASDEGTEYELAHEALISGWGRLREWLELHRDERALTDRLSRAAADWDRLKDVEMLFSEKQIEEIELLDIASVPERDRAFVVASRRRIRAKKARAWIFAIALLLLVAGIAGGLTAKARLETAARVSARLQRGETMLALAESAHHRVDLARDQAFARFDAGDAAQGEQRWESVRDLGRVETASLAVALRELEAALSIDAARSDVRSRLVEAELLRAEIAERDSNQDVLIDALARVEEWDNTKSVVPAWNAPARLRVSTGQVRARIEIGRYDQPANARWSLVALGRFAEPTSQDHVLPPGSYLLTIEADGYAPVRYPLVLRRGENRTLDIPMIEKARVPEGFIYVPEGTFMFGSNFDDVLRRTLDAVAPIHASSTGPFLIARNETTYREWIQFLDATGQDASGGPWPEGLRRSSGVWELSTRVKGQRQVIAWGEKIDLGDGIDWLRVPVERVSQRQAMAYVEWLARSGRVPSARLCSEREWERAARGADGRVYPQGDSTQTSEACFLRVPSDSYGDPVGAHAASRSPFGVDDMSGNVWELVRSDRADLQAYRGGARYNDALQLTVFSRATDAVDMVDNGVGVRVCADLPR